MKFNILISALIFQINLFSDVSFNIDETKIIGQISSDKKTQSFLGVPYAEPPIGDLRWREPIPKVFIKNEFFADRFASACMQEERIVDWYKGVAIGFGGDPNYISKPDISEDCLYLNIWRPNSTSDSLPVHVFIHGGANKAGWAYEPNYVGDKLASKGIIAVTISYRLGIFGFFSHPELSKSNFALLDIISALKWIKNNIHLVGGDPNNITIAGESAGATNIEHLLVSDLSAGLFNKAIHQSAGWSISYELDNESPAENALKLALKLSSNKEALSINELRMINPEKILVTANEIFKLGYWSVIDNHSIKKPIKESFAKGDFHNVDLIIGSNADEELMYIDNESFKELVEEREEWGIYNKVIDFEDLSNHLENDLERINFVLSSINYVCPSFYIADQVSSVKNNKVWFYSFDKVRFGKKAQEMGAYHGAELPYIFDTHDAWLPTSYQDEYLTKIIQNSWLNFMKTGNPNIDEIDWPRHKPSQFKVLSFDKELNSKIHDSKDFCLSLNI